MAVHSLHSIKVLVIALSLVLLGACTDDERSQSLTQQDCQETRAHIANLRMASFHPAGLSEERIAMERQKHIKNFSNIGGQAALGSCMGARSIAWATCVLDAGDLKQVDACEQHE